MEAAEEFAGAGDAEAVGQQQRIVVVEVVERGVELAITFELRRVAFVDAGQIESAGFVEQPRLAGQPLGAAAERPGPLVSFAGKPYFYSPYIIRFYGFRFQGYSS